jgi:hypothetical protein
LRVQAVLAINTEVPTFFLGMFPMRGLQAHGELHVTPSSLSVRSTVGAGTASVAVRYERDEQTSEGAALIDASALRFGYRLAGAGGNRLILLGAGSWFTKEAAAMDARAPRDW